MSRVFWVGVMRHLDTIDAELRLLYMEHLGNREGKIDK